MRFLFSASAAPQPAAPPAPSHRWLAGRLWWVVTGVITACVAIAYQHALQVGFLSDDHLILAFATVAPFDGSVFVPIPQRWLLFHRPLPLLLWQSMYHLWGLNPLPYHLLSLALHSLNSLLIIRLTYLLAPNSPRVALCIGLLFALLPLNVETVVWLACWFDLVGLACSIGTLIALLTAFQRGGARWYLLSIGLFQLAVWSKEAAFTLPAIALLACLFLVPRPPAVRLLAAMVPYGFVLGVNIFQRYLAWGSIGGYDSAPANLLAFAWDRSIGLAGLLLAPLNRAVFPIELVQLVGLVSGAIVLAGLIAGIERRLVVFGLGWLAFAVAPVLNLLPVGADLQNARLLYMAAVGYCIVVGAILSGLADLMPTRYRPVAQAALAVFVTLVLITTVRAQTRPWLVATKASESILSQIQAALPPARAGTILHVSGQPDNYRGAYIFRLGIDAALIARARQLYIYWPEPQHVPIPYRTLNLDRDFFQVIVQSDEQRQRWEISKVRGVTLIGPQPAFPANHWIFAMRADAFVAKAVAEEPATWPLVHGWDAGNCDAIQQWQFINLTSTCQQGVGSILTPMNDDPMVMLAGLQLQPERWTEVEVGLEAMEESIGGVTRLYWGSQSTGLDEARSLMIEMPEKSRPQRYHFIIPPFDGDNLVDLIRIDPIDQRATVRLTDVHIRQGP